MERKLAAILAADVAGYSRLMGEDEEGTLSALRAHREVVDGLIAAHRGHVFSSAGDSVVAEFPSAVEAVNCAVEIQQEVAERNEAVAKERRLEFRIGLNIGDVMAEGGNLFGDGVNVAARLQELAEPGGVCVARNVYDQVRHKVGVAFESIGEHHVKNIAEPVTVYRVLIDGRAATPRLLRSLHTIQRHRIAAAALAILLVIVSGGVAAWYLYPRAATPTRVPSLAVLPFDNLSANPDLGYFSDGVSEDIITMLSRSPDLAVVARNSSFVYKGKATDIRQVGKELGVEYVLEGSVRKGADQVRIVAQLVDARTGQHVWAERYDETGTDPWALQDEVVGRIVTSLIGETGEIRRAEYKQAWGKDTGNLEEYDWYLRGHEVLMAAETKEDYKRSQQIWENGLQRFPNSSLLRIKLGFAHYVAAFNWKSDDPAGDFKRASELAREGLAGDNLSPQTQRLGHWLMAYVKSQERDFERAWAEAEAAVALAPYDAFMLGNLANVATMAGRPDKAIEWLTIEMQRSPDFNHYYRLGWAHYVAGRYQEAIEAFQKTPRPWIADDYLILAATYVRLGRMDDARAAVKKALELDPQFTQAKWREGYFYSDPSILERQVADVAAAGLPEK
jgi:TolB-like protein/class 3 adenylate cyclase/Tfp pilus assembly protein PilF